MKFNRYFPKEHRKLLEEQYEEYIRNTTMTKKEQHALREWVKDGNSVYENSIGMRAEYGVPVEFLTVYRVEEHIRRHTKGMSLDEAIKYAMDYCGLNDDGSMPPLTEHILETLRMNDSAAEDLPF